MQPQLSSDFSLPSWLPPAVRLYLDHTEDGQSLRALARRDGRHASTVLRQVRRYEVRRDDPLLDEALQALSRDAKAHGPGPHPNEPDQKDAHSMSAPLRHPCRHEKTAGNHCAAMNSSFLSACRHRFPYERECEGERIFVIQVFPFLL